MKKLFLCIINGIKSFLSSPFVNLLIGLSFFVISVCFLGRIDDFSCGVVYGIGLKYIIDLYDSPNIKTAE